MDILTFVVIAIVVGAFGALLAWLRSGREGLHSPGEPGDADKWPRLDGS